MVRKPPKLKKWALNQMLQDSRELGRVSMVLALGDPYTHTCIFFPLPRTSTTKDIIN